MKQTADRPVFKTEQFYMPAKFLPPMQLLDKYCFPDGEIWLISDVDIETLGDEDVKVTVHWSRPLHPSSGWFGVYKKGDTNWQGTAKNIELWQKCGVSSR